MGEDTVETTPANADQIAYWNASAGETWAALWDRLDRQIEPLGRLAMDALAIGPGERLIDIGCGCGQTTLELARRAGPSGNVVGVDVSAPMLAVARRRARALSLAEVEFLEADAQTHGFDSAGADALFSRFGVMFFADPAAAFANLRSALASGGRLGFVCWRAMELNTFMTLPMSAALPLLPPIAPQPPGGPGPFAFDDADRVRAILADAGFRGVELRPHDEAIGGGDIDETLDLALKIGPLGAAVRDRPRTVGRGGRCGARRAGAPRQFRRRVPALGELDRHRRDRLEILRA